MCEELIDRLTNSLLRISQSGVEEVLELCYRRQEDFQDPVSLVASALERIGTGFEQGSVALSQVYMSGRLCEEAIQKYIPPARKEILGGHTIAMATLVDQHALGKRIVSSVLSASGYPALDFGEGLSARELVAKTVEHRVDILLISTLMYAAAVEVERVITSLAQRSLKTLVIVGGAPFRLDPTLWKAVGADYDGGNGMDVAKLVERIIEGGCVA